MEKLTIEKIENKIHELMEKIHITGEIVEHNEQTKMIAVKIMQCDWKHGHLPMDCFMRELYDLRSIYTKVTAGDGFGDYSAIHYYYFN